MRQPRRSPNPGPPLGSGTLFIVGKQDKLGDWIPNKISLTYQSDGLWSGTFGFPRGDWAMGPKGQLKVTFCR